MKRMRPEPIGASPAAVHWSLLVLGGAAIGAMMVWRRVAGSSSVSRVDPVRELVAMTHAFLDGHVPPAAFDRGFRDAFSRMPPLDAPTFRALEDLSFACADYVEDPADRVESTDLDEAGLRAAARDALARLGE